MDQSQLRFDAEHIWHPYTSLRRPLSVYPVSRAEGVRLILADGRQLIDGMSSWWSTIFGYNHPRLNAAAHEQLKRMSHVMFGGITHEPAVSLAQKLLAMTPPDLVSVFFADSGSVAVEVAMKMAFQYWHGLGRPLKKRFLTIRGGYHGDTFNAMSVCDPEMGMHTLYTGALPQNIFAPRPVCRFDELCTFQDIEEFADLLAQNQNELAAVILEPVVQGAGGMHFYSPSYLKQVRELCDRYSVLLIADEIATGFGRTGRLFACEHAAVTPDIMCLGKALTGGYLTLGAVLTTATVDDGICANESVFMHGPTFMANPLACAVANENLMLLHEYPWAEKVAGLAAGLRCGLAPAAGLPGVRDVRVLGGIGVVEMENAVDVAAYQRRFVDRGVWVRPFGKLVYVMPPYIMSRTDLARLTAAMVEVIAESTT